MLRPRLCRAVAKYPSQIIRESLLRRDLDFAVWGSYSAGLGDVGGDGRVEIMMC